MLELGKYSKEEHTRIINFLSKVAPNKVFLIGTIFYETGDKSNFTVFQNVSELNLYLRKNPIKNGNILIKGSRGIKLEKVLEYL